MREAERWAATDPDPEHRKQIESWIAGGDEASLDAAFGSPLSFGTAGIRGVLGPGPARMNRALVLRLSSAVAQYILASGGRSIVIGGDARYRSDEFVEDAVRVFADAGLEVHRFGQPVATPLVAFAIAELGVDAAVVVTASHNPPEFNGYKLYAGNGAQIIPPADRDIAERLFSMEATPSPPPATNVKSVGPSLRQSYRERLRAGLLNPGRAIPIRAVYTALHGVGGELMEFALEGIPELELLPVADQHDPDPAFSTVRFPNPEEPGSLDMAIALAEETRADLLLANDPDADRLAVAVRDGSGLLRVLNGNELGSILADFLLETRPASGRLVMTTVVSSRLLSKLAKHHGARFAETLTGFKWIATEAMRLEQVESLVFLLGYEEALGFSVGDVVRDKDGIGAALHVLEAAAYERDRGRTLMDRLDDIYARHGRHTTRLFSLELPAAEGTEEVGRILRLFRDARLEQLAGFRIAGRVDYADGVAELPPTELLALELEAGGRILVRPSGTEAKIKFYVELVSEAQVDASAQIDEIWRAIQELVR